METVVITGACGRIGTALQKRLKGKYNIIGVDRTPCEGMVHLDLSTDQSVQEAIKLLPKKIASVIHLAAYYSFDEQHSPLYEEVTVKGTERLLKALQGFEVDQFLFSSTMLVYKPGRIAEDSPIQPKWDYPLSKVRTEEKIHELRGRISSVILRIAGVYDDLCHSIPISHQIQRIYEKSIEARLFSGDITHGSAFLHMEDLIDAIVLCIEKRKALGPEALFLIGEPKTLSYDALQRQIARLIEGEEFTTFRVPKFIAKIGAFVQGLFMKSFIKPWMIDLADDHYEMDISHAGTALGWRPKRDLERTLPKMIAALKADPAGWYEANQLK